MAQFITCCISSDHGILDGHEEDVDPLMLPIQDIMDILYGIRSENRHSLFIVLRENLLPEWLQGCQVLRRPMANMSPIFVGELVRHNLDSPQRHLKNGKPAYLRHIRLLHFPFGQKYKVQKKYECCYWSNSTRSIHTFFQLEFSEHLGIELKKNPVD